MCSPGGYWPMVWFFAQEVYLNVNGVLFICQFGLE